MNTPCPCTICQSTTHKAELCPELYKETKSGFYKPSGGGGGHSHDDDDEKLNKSFSSGQVKNGSLRFLQHRIRV